MDINWSDKSIRRDYGDYGIAEMRAHFNLVTLTMDSGTFFVIGSFSNHEQFPMHYFQSFVAEVEKSAAGVAAKASADRYLAEAAAYVRTRPEGCRSEYFEADDEEATNRHLEDIRSAVAAALAHSDLYQAARAFESIVPFLVADFELIELMEPIVSNFRREFESDMSLWVEKVASARQSFICTRSPLVRGETQRLLESFSAPVAGVM